MLAGGKFPAGAGDCSDCGCSAHVTKPEGTKSPGRVVASTGETFRIAPGTSPQKPPTKCPECFSEPPPAAWLFLKNHHLGFSESVLLLSLIALPVLYLEVFFKWLEQQAFCCSPWETKSQANQQPARVSSMALTSLSSISLQISLIFCVRLNKK